VIERALISVFDKTGLDGFVRNLHELGLELVASGGTATFIEELGLPVTRVEDLTESPEMLGGRVKTLHPRIHAGILARRDRDDDVEALAEHDIRPFDLVCVNLYPFRQVAARKDVREEEAVEMIDIGGPAMLRAAAKNFVHVLPVCSANRFGSLVAELRETGGVGIDTRRALAAEAFAHTAAYEASIAAWFSDRETFPDSMLVSLEKVIDLPYGENPHQRAAYYAEAGARRHLLSRVDQLAGKQLSFNNLYDLDAARALVREVAAAFAGQGVEFVSLEVGASNEPARAVYARWGFREDLLELVVPLETLADRLRDDRVGRTFGSVHVQTDDQAAIERAVRQFVPRLPGGSRGSIVSAPRHGWIGVYDDAADRDPSQLARLARELSDRMGAVVLAIGVEEGAVVRFTLLDRGRVMDEYLSVQEYYGPLPPGDVIALAANPTVVARLTGADRGAIRAAAVHAPMPAELPPPVDVLRGIAAAMRIEGADVGYADAASLPGARILDRL